VDYSIDPMRSESPHMTVRDAIRHAERRLSAAGTDAPRLDAWLFLARATGRDRTHLVANSTGALTREERLAFETMVARRAGREPLAQILGEREFWSLPFKVDHRVLCPRPETEILVEAALRALNGAGARAGRRGSAPLRLLDLGTGSGCLLLALLSELPGARGLGVDVSPAALDVASINAERLGLAGRASFRLGDWGDGLGGPFDLILSNPPYIRRPDHAALEPEVRAFEPKEALIAGEDGLLAYRRLAPDLARLLAEDGFACLELGAGQASAVTALMTAAGLEPAGLHADLAGIERCLMLRPGANLRKTKAKYFSA
jgi:release factor glutamine methyltransferase